MKLNVLFVDDDAGFKRRIEESLAEIGDSWEFTFVASGRKALLAMELRKFDAVVAAFDMESMNGVELLQRVRSKQPGVVRIILHAHQRQDTCIRSIDLAHQALGRSCSADEICTVINRAMRLKSLFLAPDFHEQISQISALPTPPVTYRQLVAEFQEAEPSVSRIAEIITRDLGLMTKLLQIVNSAFFSLPQKISDPMHAIVMLGLDMVQSLALATGIFNQFEVKGLGYLTTEWLADHSILVGRRARRIAEYLGCDSQTCSNAMLSGLLHDTGKLVELGFFRDKVKAIGGLALKEEISLGEAEQAVLGTSHAELGAHMLALWGMPFAIVEAVAFHHQPLRAGDAMPNELAAVHLADAFFWEECRERPRPPLPTGGSLDMEFVAKLGVEASLPALRQLETISML